MLVGILIQLWVGRDGGGGETHTLHGDAEDVTADEDPGVQVGLQERDIRSEDNDQMLQVQIQARGQKRRGECQPNDLQFECSAVEGVVAESDTSAIS